MIALKILLIVIITPVIGCLLSGLDRKITAHFQGRVGPPLLQPLYDVIKLLNKENVVVNRYQNIYIIAYLVFVLSSIIMLFFEMDILMIIFVYTIANISLIIGSMSTGSPYSRIGSQREIMSMLSYEPVLLFYIISIYLLTGSFNLTKLNTINKPLLVYLPLIFLSMLFIMNIKFKKSPFDFSTSHHAHQELVKGMFTEFSGSALAVIELTHWYEIIFLLWLIFLFWKSNIIIGLLLASLTYIFVLILDNITARLSWEWMLRTTWTFIIALSIANILFIYIYGIKLT